MRHQARSDPYLVLRVLDGIFPDELQLDQLQELIRVGYPIKGTTQVFKCLLMADTDERSEGVSLAGVIALRLEEGGDEIGSIGDEGLRMLVDGGHGKDGVLPNIGMTMLEA